MNAFITIDSTQLVTVTGGKDINWGEVGNAALDGAGKGGSVGMVAGAGVGAVAAGPAGILPGAGAGGLIGTVGGGLVGAGANIKDQLSR